MSIRVCVLERRKKAPGFDDDGTWSGVEFECVAEAEGVRLSRPVIAMSCVTELQAMIYGGFGRKKEAASPMLRAQLFEARSRGLKERRSQDEAARSNRIDAGKSKRAKLGSSMVERQGVATDRRR